jgi:Sap, sulfolipid-1-addressing protein
VREREHESRETTRKISARLRDPSVTTVAAAGVLTHLPGLVYLIALNAIIATDPTIATGLLQVVTYNAIWFAIPLLSLALAIVRPDRTSELVEGVNDWTRRHRRTAVPLLLAALGIYLLVKGLTGLL